MTNKLYLDKEFDKFWQKIENGENFVLLRYGDGERAIMCGEKVTAQEGWVSPNYISELGRALLDTLDNKDPNVYYGISCPCCDPRAYFWYSTRIKNKNRTFANLWVNANYQKFITKFDALQRDAILIANHNAHGKKIGNLNILKHYEIGDDCISFWENDAPALVEQIKNEFGDRKDLLYVVSAGPMSEPIIMELFHNSPDNCYIDFGSSIDKYIHNKQTRPYMDPKTTYAKQRCYMYDPHTTDFDVSVVLTLYKRPECLETQLTAIANQSLKPKQILLYQDGTGDTVKIPEHLKQKFDVIEISPENRGVWARFDFARKNVKTKYVCMFDDDTIPGPRWLENCMTEMMTREGLYGTIGILCHKPAYVHKSHTRIGWANPNNKTVMVDFVGHSWFLQTKWLDYLFENTAELQAYKICGEDMTLSQKLQEHGINTFVPPHPENDKSLWGSLTEYSYKFGNDKNSLFVNNGWTKMSEAFNLLVTKYHFGLVRKRYPKEYRKALKSTGGHKTNFWKNLFSINNKYIGENLWKVVTIFGMDIKIRKK